MTTRGELILFPGVEKTLTDGTITYRGYAKVDVQSVDTEEPIWLISREYTSNDEFTREYASNDFNQIWDNKVDLFPFLSSTKSILFDGVNDILTVDDTSAFRLSNGVNDLAFSWSSWLKFTDASNCVMSSKGTTSNREWKIYTSASDFFGVTFNTSAADDAAIIGAYTPSHPLTPYEGIWTQLGVTYDGSGSRFGITMYVNGVTVVSTKVFTGVYTTMNNSGLGATIGGWGAGFYLDGGMDELSMWVNYELSEAEMLEVYNDGVPSNLDDHSAAASLTSWYHMGDGCDDIYPVITDHKELYDLTMVGMTEASIVEDAPPT